MGDGRWEMACEERAQTVDEDSIKVAVVRCVLANHMVGVPLHRLRLSPVHPAGRDRVAAVVGSDHQLGEYRVVKVGAFELGGDLAVCERAGAADRAGESTTKGVIHSTPR